MRLTLESPGGHHQARGQTESRQKVMVLLATSKQAPAALLERKTKRAEIGRLRMFSAINLDLKPGNLPTYSITPH
jgi:hypothetical protein